MSRKKKKKRIFWVYFTIVFAFIVYIFFIDSAGYLKKYLTKRENKKYRELIIAQEKENEHLKQENKLLKSSNKKIEENTYKYIGYRNKLKKYARENRKNPTKSAMIIWEILRNKQINGYKFTQEKPLYEFIADFYCAELLLVIEVDGGYHDETKEYDSLRSEILKAYNIDVIRIKNEDILNNINKVKKDLTKLLDF